MAKKSILLIGASSFIGKNFLKAAPPEWDIDATYCNDVHFLEFCKPFTNINPIHLDLRAEIKTPKKEYDLIIYLAANSDPKKSIDIPYDDFLINAGGVIKILTSISCKRFVYFSSGAVYLKSSIPYVLSKRAGEEYVKYFCEKNKVPYVILRLFESFGPYSPKRKIFRKVCEAMENNQHEISVVGDGTNLVDPMYVEDTVHALISIVSIDSDSMTLDLCTGNPLTINEVIHKIGEVYQKNIHITHVGIPVESVFYSGDPTSLKEVFHFTPKYTFEEGIRKWRTLKLI